jgi:hypothetical protein
MLALLNPMADITVSRTVNSISAGTGKLTLAGDSCTSSDTYGSNNCNLYWAKSYAAAANGTLTKDIVSGDTFTADFTIDELLPFKFTCQLCGVDCSFTLPVVQKRVSFAMPACPITAGAVHATKTLMLPASSPVPLTTGFKGTVIAQDKAGNSLASINVQQHDQTPPLSSAHPSAPAPPWRAWRRGGLGCSSTLLGAGQRPHHGAQPPPGVLERKACIRVTDSAAVGHPGAGDRVEEWRRRPARRGLVSHPVLSTPYRDSVG